MVLGTYHHLLHITKLFDPPTGQLRVERRRHRQHRQVLRADAPVLPGHVRVQRVPRLGHGAAEHAPIPGADRVFVLQMRPQRVRRSVDLAALRTRSRVRRSNSLQV